MGDQCDLFEDSKTLKTKKPAIMRNGETIDL